MKTYPISAFRNQYCELLKNVRTRVPNTKYATISNLKNRWERKAEDRSLGGGNYFLSVLILTQTARIVTAPRAPMIIEELMSAVMNALADAGEFIGNTEKMGS